MDNCNLGLICVVWADVSIGYDELTLCAPKYLLNLLWEHSDIWKNLVAGLKEHEPLYEQTVNKLTIKQQYVNPFKSERKQSGRTCNCCK